MKKDQKTSDEARAKISEARRKAWANPEKRKLASEVRQKFWSSERGAAERQRRLAIKQATAARRAAEAAARPPKQPKPVKVKPVKELKSKPYVSRKNPPLPSEWEIRDRLSALGKLTVSAPLQRSSTWVHPRLREPSPVEFPDRPSTPTTVRKYRINRKTRVPILIRNRNTGAFCAEDVKIDALLEAPCKTNGGCLQVSD